MNFFLVNEPALGEGTFSRYIPVLSEEMIFSHIFTHTYIPSTNFPLTREKKTSE